MKKIISLTVIFIICAFNISAQKGQGSIKGIIINDTGETVPFANVVVLKDSNQILGTSTDFDGKFVLKPLPPDTYDVEVSFVGYQSVITTNVVVHTDSITYLGAKITQGVDLEIVFAEYSKTSFPDNFFYVDSITRKKNGKMAERSVADIVKTAGEGIVSRGCGSNNLVCTRAGATVTFIDGVKVINTTKTIRNVIELVSVKLRGTSAQYENEEKWQIQKDNVYGL